MESVVKKILIAGFEGNKNSAKVLLDKLSSNFLTMYLYNNKSKSVNQLAPCLDKYDVVFIFGQKPLIKDKISFELCGTLGAEVYETTYPVKDILEYFKDKYCAKVSRNAGTSYCNNINYNMLKINTKAKVLFIHIPFLKNISDFTLLVDLFNQYFLLLFKNE